MGCPTENFGNLHIETYFSAEMVHTTPFLRVKTVISHFCFSSPLPRLPPATDRVTSTSLVARANLLSALLIFCSCSVRVTPYQPVVLGSHLPLMLAASTALSRMTSYGYSGRSSAY